MKKLLLLLTILLFYANLFGQGQIINVPADQPTIQSAINVSEDGDTVLVADGTYYENINFNGKAITLASHFFIDGDSTHIDSTIINGSNPNDSQKGSVVTIDSGEDTTSVVYGFTITGGKGNYNSPTNSKGGGGIVISKSGAKILFNNISENLVQYEHIAAGGGILIDSPLNSVILSNNSIINNNVISPAGHAFGAGILCINSPTKLITIAENVIANNKTLSGSNTLAGIGGGIYLDYSNPLIRNNLIKNNKALAAGGIYFKNYPGSNNPIVVNNTIILNEASSNTGGVGNDSDGSVPQILNSIVWGNKAPIDKQINDNILVEYSCIEGGFTGRKVIDGDPQFADTTNFNLSSSSPCIDAGNPLTIYYDFEDSNNSGFPIAPALGGLRNDIGAYGGNPNMIFADLPEPIAALKVDNDNNYIPDKLNEFIITTGVVSSINFEKSSGDLGFYIYDKESGIYVFAENDDSTNFELGDWIEVHGKIDQDAGCTEIIVNNTSKNLVLLEQNHALLSTTLYIDELLKNPEKYEGIFVRINAVKKESGDWPTSSASTNVNVTDGYKTLNLKLDNDTDLGSNQEPTYPIDIEGVFSQYTNSQPANDGYQILVNSYSDIAQDVQAAPSPYFFFKPDTKKNENGDYGAADYNDFTVYLEWYPAVDLNGDNLTYEVVVIRNDGVIVSETPSDMGGTRTRSSRTNAQVIDFVQEHGENNTFTGSWVIRVTDGNSGIIASLDTLKNFTLNDLVTDVEDENILPKEFELSQNYPNPFNPETVISYQLPVSGNTKLIVFDILGREIVTLVNKRQKPGNYEVNFDGKNLSSGIYFYSLHIGDFTATKKMILLK